MRDLIAYRCPNFHIIGMIWFDARNISHLAILKRAQISKPKSININNIVATSIGWTDIRCSICGETKRFFVSSQKYRLMFADQEDEFLKRLKKFDED